VKKIQGGSDFPRKPLGCERGGVQERLISAGLDTPRCGGPPILCGGGEHNYRGRSIIARGGD